MGARHVNLIGDVVRWVLDPAHYQGADALQTRVFEHVQLSGAAILAGALIALPIGLALGHTGRLAFVAVNVANVGRAIPSLALIALALPLAFSLHLGLGFWPTLFALIPLSIPPMLTNTYVAVRGVSRDSVEAARGMGLSELGILRTVELPLALPIILSGIRTAAVNVVATATLGALVAGGGLGRYIVDGLALQEYDRLLTGAILVALLAIVVEIAFAQLERFAVSPGIQAESAAL
jgi:osmoprotectant transport system permease protein